MTIHMAYSFGKISIPLSILDISSAYWPSRKRKETNTAKAQREDRTKIRRGRVAKATIELDTVTELATREIAAASTKAQRLIAASKEKADQLSDKALDSDDPDYAAFMYASAKKVVAAATIKADELVSNVEAAHESRVIVARAALTQAEAALREYEPAITAPIIEDLEVAAKIVRQQILAKPPSWEDLARVMQRYDDKMYDHDGKLAFWAGDDTNSELVKLDLPEPPWSGSSFEGTEYDALLDRVVWLTINWLKVYGGNCTQFMPVHVPKIVVVVKTDAPSETE